MALPPLVPLVRRAYVPAALLRDHPPRLDHPHKRLAYELASAGPAPAGEVVVTRWAAASLPEHCELAATEVVIERGHYRYDGGAAEWHVNFADPSLFFAYGSGLLAQDELQCVEHPVLGAIREALLAEGQPARTEDHGPTPVLVVGAERRCEFETAPDPAAGRPHGLYGNRFATADAAAVRRAVRPLTPPTRTNLIAMAAPSAGHGVYRPAQLEQILVTAYTAFLAARTEARTHWPAAAVEIRTGFWGCGAFGGNRHAMTLLQVLAARLAGIERVRFYAFDEQGQADAATGLADLDAVLRDPSERVDDVLARISARGYAWGISNGT